MKADRERLEELRDERDNYEIDEDENAAPDGPGHANNASAWAAENPDDAEELAELEKAVTIEGRETDEDGIRERIQESPLSVEVRSGWHAPGAEDDGPEEFCILLSTGGPALRIIGDLDQHCQPTRARLQYQDWFTPWTEKVDVDHDALLKWCSEFYFGD